MAEIGIIASVIGVAGAGFRLSLILNAVSSELATADVEIQSIARGISLFSLMLKQVGLAMEGAKSIASQSALDTAKEITGQSELVFEEIKSMVEIVQRRDDKGHFRAITVSQRIKWCFKKQKVQYLLAQLESLKLSLSIMLQTLQLGKRIADTQEIPSKPPPQERDMLQERAEIQNMVVVRYWALVELRRLFQLAQNEDDSDIKSPLESPPPSYADGVEHPGGDPRLAIEPAPLASDDSKALVKYHEKPLEELHSSLYKAMANPDRILENPDSNVVDYLLKEWTRLREIEKQRPHMREQKKTGRYGARYETDESDTSSEDEFESVDGKGRYITNGHSKPKAVKNVRFRARVESDSEDSDRGKPRSRAPSRHVLRSDSSSSCSSASASPPPHARRSSDISSSQYRPPPPGFAERAPRPYTQPRDGTTERPGSRNAPSEPGSPYPRLPMPNQQWQSTPQSPGLRPPPQLGQFPSPNGYYPPPPQGPQRMPSAGPYGVPPPGYSQSPQPPSGFYGPPRGPPGLPQQRAHHHHHHHHDSRRRDGGSEKSTDGKKEKGRTTGKDVKRGLLGAAGVAGLLDLLGGLDGI